MRGKFPEFGVVRGRHVWTIPYLSKPHLREVGLPPVFGEKLDGDPCLSSCAFAGDQARVLVLPSLRNPINELSLSDF